MSRKKALLVSLTLCLLLSLAAVGPVTGQEDEIVIGVYEPMTGAQAAGGELTMQGVRRSHGLGACFQTPATSRPCARGSSARG